MRVRVGVVGAGYLGHHHARIYSEMPEAKLIGVVDTDERKAGEVAERYGVRAYRDHRDMLDAVDALSVVVPTTEHFSVALDCVRAGKDILVEKPITSTVAQADELISEAGKEDRILQVGHLERYNAGVVTLSMMIDDPRFIEAVRLSPFLNRGCDVDVTLDLMIHDIDIVLSLVRAPIKSVRAFGVSLVTDKIDEARAWIEFENGAVASLTASRVSREKKRKLRVFQRDKRVELDYQTCAVEVFSQQSPLRPEIISSEYREPLKEELEDFVHHVLTRERPKVSGSEGRDALSVALEIGSCMEHPR